MSAARGARPALLAACLLVAVAGDARAEGPLLPLQPRIDAAPPGATLRLEPGRYAGPVVLHAPLVLDGGGRATIDGGGRGTVVSVLTDGATVRGLRIVGSGDDHDGLDAGVRVRGRGNRIEDNVMEDVLFGVELQQSDGNEIRGNRIRSKPAEMGVRGDGIRLWYSRGNRIEDNRIADVRDVVVWYSADNVIARNHVTGGRYALHFMYSEYNRVEGNRFHGNMVGVFLMYSDGVELVGNDIRDAQGATGMGVGFKETSDVTLEDNTIVYCAKGIYLDVSPYQPDTTNRFLRNRIAYNGVGVTFHNDWQGNRFEANRFQGNFTQVAVRGGGSAKRNVWRANRWDDYGGFDRDHDGTGDTPYRLFAWSDRIWMDVPAAAFFRGSPLLEALDFLERLAPFSEPTLILEDAAPRLDGGGDA